MTSAGVTSLREQSVIFVLQLSLCLSLLSVSSSRHPPLIFSLRHSLAPSHSFFLHPALYFFFLPPSLTSSEQGRFGPGAMLCCLICTAHSCSFYYCPSGGGGPFLWPDNGRRRDREHGGHVPFATPCYLSILARPPPSHTHPTLHTRCPLFNSTLILLQERKTWEPSIRPKPPGPQLYTYY